MAGVKGMQQDSRLVRGWPTYTDPQRRYALRHPPGWFVRNESPDVTTISEPEGHAAFSIRPLNLDCGSAQAGARKRRLNYYLAGEFTRRVAMHDAHTLEFRDTVSNSRSFHVFVPAERGCYELTYTHSERSEGQDLKATLEAMLSTFEIFTNLT